MGEGSEKVRLTVITPRRALLDLGLGELWHYRELLYFLVWRDVKVRYKQTVLGALWAILQPFLSMVVFSLLFGRLAKMPSEGVAYPIFVYSALVPWWFFANSLSGSGNSLVGNERLITKVYFPRLAIPLAAVLAHLVDFCLATAMMGLLMLYYRASFGLSLLLVFPLTVLIVLLAAGVGLWLSALNVRYRDVQYVIPFLIQMWLFVTPVIYPMEIIPEKYKLLISINPMTGIVNGFRAAFLGQPIDAVPLAVSCVVAALVLYSGMIFFRRMERSFADVI